MKTTLVAVLAGTILALPASGAVIVQYDFAGGSGTPGTEHEDVTGGVLTANGGMGDPELRSDGGNPGGCVYYEAEDVLGSLASAIADNDYLGFTVTPDGGHTVTDWASLVFDVSASHVNQNAPFKYTLQYSTDDATYATVGAEYVFPGPTGNPSWQAGAGVIDVSALPGLAGGDAMYFRLYLYANSDTGSFEPTRNGRIDNLTLSGTVVPEPATLALVGLVMAAAFARRKRTSAARA